MSEFYPFKIPDRLISRLPKQSADGHYYVDVRVGSMWDGILVINQQNEGIGIFVGGRIIQYPTPFNPDEIDDIRKPCLSNWVWASLPRSWDPVTVSLFVFPIVNPILIATAIFVLKWVAFVPVLVGWSCIDQMYRVRGFTFVRPLLALLGASEMICCLWLLVTRQH